MRGDRMPVTTVLLVVTGILSLLPVAGGERALLLTAAVLFVGWSIAERRTAARLPVPFARAADFLVATSIVAIAVLHVAMESASLLTIGHVLAISQLARAFRKKDSRDFVVLNGTAVAQAALAAFLTRAPLYLPLLFGVVIFGVYASVRLTRLGVPEQSRVRVFTGRPRGSAGIRARIGAVMEPLLLTLCVLLVGVGFFVVLPRGRHFLGEDGRPAVGYEGAWSEVRTGRSAETGPVRYTGFSDRVALGEVGRIKENQREAFTVKISEGRRAFRTRNALYFRGAVFDTFDGREWSREVEPTGGERWLTTDTFPARIPVRDLEDLGRPGTRLLRQEFRMQATFARALPGCGTVTTVRLNDDLPKVLVMSGGTFAAPASLPSSGLAYELTALVSLQENRPAVADPIGQQEADLCRTLPPGMTRLELKAREIAGEGHPLEKAAKITAWLKNQCEYTLRFRPWPSGRPVHDFLFVTHAGHCEYFASAQALMMRAVGVPTRVVAGYRGGLWIEHLESYYVRMSEAHAWVEAYVPGRGWVTVDPTPSDGSAINVPESRVPGEGISDLQAIPEKIATLVTEFGPAEREQAFSAVAGGVEFVFREGFGLGRPARSFPPPLTVLFGAGLLTLIAWRLVGVRLRPRGARGMKPHGRRSAKPPESPFYEKAVVALARAGIVRRSTQSPREFLDDTVARRPDGTRSFREITLTFEDVRYGHRLLLPTEEEEMRRLVDRLEDGLRPTTK